MGTAKSQIKRMLHRAGVEVTGYQWTIESRRRRLLRNVDVLADVGANVGQYAQAARGSGWGGRIISYEPLAAAFVALRLAAESDPAWTVVHTAVGSEVGDLTLNVSANDVFSSALPTLDRGRNLFTGMAAARAEQVSVATLDGLLAEQLDQGLRIGVKVDVQGFERAVLLGAARTLELADFWEMELTPAPLYEGQMLMAEGLERLADAGLTLVGVENIFTDVHTGRSLQFNGLFLRD